MSKILIVANWKENLGQAEAEKWMEEFGKQEARGRRQEVAVVICPSFPLIPLVSNFRLPNSLTSQPFNLRIGAQDVSCFEKGAYTGEVSASQLGSLGVKYVIVGHSERRRYFGETSEQVNQKIRLCLKYSLVPTVCVSEVKQVQAIGSFDYPLVVAYEPLTAISTGETGRPDTPSHAQKMALAIKNILGNNVLVLYGGSVDESNVRNFLQEKDVNGVLVGGASLNAEEFSRLVKQVLYELH